MMKKQRVVKLSKEQIEAEEFKTRHRHSEKAFTRDRSLPFSLVLVLVLRNSVKSLQNVVNEAMTWLNEPFMTASAYSQARYKLKHTAFIELNKVAVVDTLYSDSDYKTFWGFRVLGLMVQKSYSPTTKRTARNLAQLPGQVARPQRFRVSARMPWHPCFTTC